MLNLVSKKSVRRLYLFLAKNPRIVPLLVLIILPILVIVPYIYIDQFENLNGTPIIEPTKQEAFITTYHVTGYNSKNPSKFSENAENDYARLVYLPYGLFGLERVQGDRTTGHIQDVYNIDLTSILFVGLSLLYAFYPLRYNTEEYFKKHGLRDMIIKYELVKKILYVEIPLLVFFTSFLYFFSPSALSPDFNVWLRENLYLSVISSVVVGLQYSVTAGILWLSLQMSRKEFRYHLARAYIKTIPDNCENYRKLELLIQALNLYNKYLLRTIKLQIDNRFYSTLVVESSMKMTDHINSLSESFDETDKFMPARRLSEMMRIDKNEEFMVRQTVGSIIITWGTMVGAILTVVVSVVQLLFQPKH